MSISQQPHIQLQNLPDLRTAQRLVDVLDQLERALGTRAQTSQPAAAAPVQPASPATAPADLALRAENAALKRNQQQALKRLDALLARLQPQAEAEAGQQPETQQEAAA